MKVVITGATGYIGTHLTALLIRRGWDVVMASRKQPASLMSWIHFDLSSEKPVVLPADSDLVIHLAAITISRNLLSGVDEVIAAKRLIKSACKVGASFLFVSSQAAHEKAPTTYGRTKWAIEKEVLAVGGTVVRPGLVYGGELRGLYGTLVKVIQKSLILPSFIPAPQVLPIHVDDLTEGLLRITELNTVPSCVYHLASVEPVPFSSFLDEIARTRLDCRRIFLPIPIIAVNLCISVIGAKWRTRLGLDRLHSLFNLPVMETASDLEQLKLNIRSLDVGLQPEKNIRRKRLLREGKSLFTYILKEKPSGSMLRHYVRAIDCLRDGNELGLPKIVLKMPILLSLIDKSSWRDASAGDEFVWRLDAATILAEASPEGARRFLSLERKHGLPSSVLSITVALVNEIFWKLLRVLASPLLQLGISRTTRVS